MPENDGGMTITFSAWRRLKLRLCQNRAHIFSICGISKFLAQTLKGVTEAWLVVVAMSTTTFRGNRNQWIWRDLICLAAFVLVGEQACTDGLLTSIILWVIGENQTSEISVKFRVSARYSWDWRVYFRNISLSKIYSCFSMFQIIARHTVFGVVNRVVQTGVAHTESAYASKRYWTFLLILFVLALLVHQIERHCPYTVSCQNTMTQIVKGCIMHYCSLVHTHTHTHTITITRHFILWRKKSIQWRDLPHPDSLLAGLDH